MQTSDFCARKQCDRYSVVSSKLVSDVDEQISSGGVRELPCAGRSLPGAAGPFRAGHRPAPPAPSASNPAPRPPPRRRAFRLDPRAVPALRALTLWLLRPLVSVREDSALSTLSSGALRPGTSSRRWERPQHGSGRGPGSEPRASASGVASCCVSSTARPHLRFCSGLGAPGRCVPTREASHAASFGGKGLCRVTKWRILR